jgi:1-acyl-sn-glycerol-3-phosphate acyltransferase
VLYRWVLYPFAKALLAVLFFICGPTRIRGSRNVPRKTGVLILANHISDADPPMMGYAVPRPAHFMAKSELFSVPILGSIMRAYRAFPVSRGAPDRAALRHAIKLLESGECVVMFPEGEVSETGKMQALLPGAALIIRSADAPVVCCGLAGTDRIIPFRKLMPRPAFRTVRVTFGEPHTFAGHAPQEEILAWITGELRRLGAPSEAV